MRSRRTYQKLIALAVVLLVPAVAVAQGTVAVPFEGTCNDPEDNDISASLIWTSDVQGQVAAGAAGTMNLNEGVHVITASCGDSGGNTSTANVTITVTIDNAPTVIIIQPADGSSHGG